jgi:hypothetical protein
LPSSIVNTPAKGRVHNPFFDDRANAAIVCAMSNADWPSFAFRSLLSRSEAEGFRFSNQPSWFSTVIRETQSKSNSCLNYTSAHWPMRWVIVNIEAGSAPFKAGSASQGEVCGHVCTGTGPSSAVKPSGSICGVNPQRCCRDARSCITFLHKFTSGDYSHQCLSIEIPCECSSSKSLGSESGCYSGWGEHGFDWIGILTSAANNYRPSAYPALRRAALDGSHHESPRPYDGPRRRNPWSATASFRTQSDDCRRHYEACGFRRLRIIKCRHQGEVEARDSKSKRFRP